MKEDLGAQEPLVAHVHGELVLGDGVHPGVLLDVNSRATFLRSCASKKADFNVRARGG